MTCSRELRVISTKQNSYSIWEAIGNQERKNLDLHHEFLCWIHHPRLFIPDSWSVLAFFCLQKTYLGFWQLVKDVLLEFSLRFQLFLVLQVALLSFLYLKRPTTQGVTQCKVILNISCKIDRHFWTYWSFEIQSKSESWYKKCVDFYGISIVMLLSVS